METSNINVRVDSDLKQNAESLFSDLGMNMSTAITIFLKTAVRCDGIPFDVKRPAPNAVTRAALAESDEMQKDHDKYKRYDSFSDVLEEVLPDA